MADVRAMLTLLVALTAAVPAAAADPSEARQAELMHRVLHDCGSCHGLTLKGGLGPPLLPTTLDGKSDEGLATVILDGLPGTPMPPWAFEIAHDEAVWLVKRLKEGLDHAP